MADQLPIASRFQPPPGSERRSGLRTKLLVLLFTIGLPAAIVGTWFAFARGGLGELGDVGPMVYVPGDDGGRIYQLTSQVQTIVLPGRRTGASQIRTNLLIDLWAFRASDTAPVWRRRLASDPSGSTLDHVLLGVHGNTIWLLERGALHAFAADTGDALAGPETIEQATPELRGMMPSEPRYYAFDTHGLRVTAADARIWRLEPDTFKARPDAPVGDAIGNAHPPVYSVPTATYLFQQRGIDIPGSWLGLLNDAEALEFEKNNTLGGLDFETRRRLWRLTATTDENFFGDYLDYSDPKPLPAAPDFLGGGLLAEYHSGQPEGVIWLRDPDSVVVLHHDRLGEEGRLVLTRIAGPEGETVWNSALPLTILQSIARTPEGVVLFGYEIFPPPDGRPRDPYHNSPRRIVSVDLNDGTFHVFRLDAVEEHPEALGVERLP